MSIRFREEWDVNPTGETDGVLEQVLGLVIPVAWGPGGEVIQVALAAFDESEYLVIPQGRGLDLLGHLQREMAVKGRVSIQGGKKMILVESFKTMVRPKSKNLAKLTLAAAICLFVAGQLAPALAADQAAPATQPAIKAAPKVQAKPVVPVYSNLVLMVQKALAEKGYELNPDGIINQATSEALKDFQEKNGLKATGKINQNTRKALGID